MSKGSNTTLTRRTSPMVSQQEKGEASPLVTEQENGASEDAMKAMVEFPLGDSLFAEIWKRDPASASLKTLYMVLTAAGLTSLFFLSKVVPWIFPNADKDWDARNGMDPTTQHGFLALPILVHKALHLPLETSQALFAITAGVCVLLILADILTAGPDTCHSSPYPKQWDTQNTKCYHDMFSEPTRFGRLLRRPGNALSNAPFLLGSLCVLASVVTNQDTYTTNSFWMADAQFGVLLLLLAVTSFLWHGSNAPWSQYPDIWSMDCCIFYLIIRSVCMGLVVAVVRFGPLAIDPESAKAWAGGACAVVYAAVIVMGGFDKYSWYQKRYLHGHCPFSVRARLSGAGAAKVNSKKKHVPVAELALFGSMPVIYISIPLVLQLNLLQSTGSAMAGDLLAQTLVIAWTYRIWDRWVLDGSAPMNFFVNMKPSLVRTVGTALFSPTGTLHFFSGITLVAAYVHVRTLDESFDAALQQ